MGLEFSKEKMEYKLLQYMIQTYTYGIPTKKKRGVALIVKKYGGK